MELEWTETYWPLIMAFMVPTIIAGLTVPDSFAGEKERNTLSTLLASRLPDRAILFGKMFFGIVTSWMVGLVMLVIGLIVVNLAAGDGGFLFYAPKVLLAYLAISLLMATVTTSAGVLISMRSNTAQEASQMLISILLMPPLLLGVGATTLLMGNVDLIESLDGDVILLIVAGVLLAGSIGLTMAAKRRFRRARLVFD
jgi:ABC-2 type transport system permease protein